MWIIRINNEQVFDKYCDTYEEALSEYEYYNQIMSKVEIIEVKHENIND